MVLSEDIKQLNHCLNDLISSKKLVYDHLRRFQNEELCTSLFNKSNEFLKSENDRMNQVKAAFESFSKQVSEICENYKNTLDDIEMDSQNRLNQLYDDIDQTLERVNKKSCQINQKMNLTEESTSFVYYDNKKSKMTAELVRKYPGSYLYMEYMSERRIENGDIFIDCSGENDELIVKYMKDDENLKNDLKKLNLLRKQNLLNDLDFLELPIKKYFIHEFGRNDDNKKMEAWRNKRIVMVNGKNCNELNTLLKQYKLLDALFNNEPLKNIHYDKQNSFFFIDLKLKYLDVIETYLRNAKVMNIKLLTKDRGDINSEELIKEMSMVGVELSEEEKNQIRSSLDPRFLRDSVLLLDTQYDSYLREWVGDKQMKLIYRASEHGYRAKSFHEYCDNKGPTLIIIKSSEGWIFGGYTTQSWGGGMFSYS